MLKKDFCVGIVSLILYIAVTDAQAFFDLLAGVEAGIDTDTAMTSNDLQLTQKILSTEMIGKQHKWVNDTTGNAYEITIIHQYSYGHYPCLAYKLVIVRDHYSQAKSLDACKNTTGQWISVTTRPTTL